MDYRTGKSQWYISHHTVEPREQVRLMLDIAKYRRELRSARKDCVVFDRLNAAYDRGQ